MSMFVLNTDFAHGANGADVQWIRRGIAVTSGELEYKERLEMLSPGDKLALYVNSVGIIAVGTVRDTPVVVVTGNECINPAESHEYHRKVTWDLVFRDQPISPTDANAAGIYALRAVQPIIKGQAALLARLAAIASQATSDRDEYERRAAALLTYGLITRPYVSTNPGRTAGTSTQFYRDPAVRAWTLQRSNFMCELCGNAAPFRTDRGLPFLESHHIVPLAEGGGDTPDNTAALCPNCHRKMHYGSDRFKLRVTLQQSIRANEA